MSQVHSEALVLSVTERSTFGFRTILKHYLSFLSALTFCHKSRESFPIELWHHDTKISAFRGSENHFSRVKRNLFLRARWKTRGRGPGVRGPGVRCPGVWKTRGLVENAGSGGKRGVRWKTRGLVENAGSGGKRGVWWKTRGLMWKTRGTTIFRLNKMTGQNIVG